MARRTCLTCGTLTTTTRCPPCQRAWDRNRNATRAGLYRGDGGHHERLRNLWAVEVATGLIRCPRCGQPINGPFDLGHQDDGTRRPEHPACNRGARTNPGVTQRPS